MGYADKTDQLVNQLKSLNESMQENLSQSLLRGEKIELVNERSNSLMKTSGGYLTTSKQVKREMQCRRYKMIAAAVFVVLVSKVICANLSVACDPDNNVFNLRHYF